MLNIERFKKIEDKYEKAQEEYLVELKIWEKRAREVFQLYYELSGKHQVLSGYKIELRLYDDTVGITAYDYTTGITATDFDENVMASYAIAIEDFIADDYVERLTVKYQEEEKQKEEKKQKDLEAAERAEWERLKKKYGE